MLFDYLIILVKARATCKGSKYSGNYYGAATKQILSSGKYEKAERVAWV